MNRLVLKRSLEADGHVVTMADERPCRARDPRGRRCPTSILLDILMPELDGFAVLDRVKADPRLREIPVIMISALDEMDSVVRCIEAGRGGLSPEAVRPHAVACQDQCRPDEATACAGRAAGVSATSSPGSCRRRSSTRSCATRTASHGWAVCASSAPSSSATSAASRRSPSGRPPEVVVDVLNHYFSEMSDAILDDGGTLLGFLGDGILAVFGAPIASDDHADRALAVARQMLYERLPRFNEWARSELGENADFRMGIGISAGRSCRGTSARRAASSTRRSVTLSTRRRGSKT